MDFIFLLQILLVYIFWVIGHYFYKHSDWLHSNKPVIFSIPNFPKVSNFLAKHFNNDGVLFYTFGIIIFGAAFLGGIIILYLMATGISNELSLLMARYNWWQQVLVWFCLISFYFGLRIWWNGKRKKDEKKNIP